MANEGWGKRDEDGVDQTGRISRSSVRRSQRGPAIAPEVSEGPTYFPTTLIAREI
jgi:hypothetical protein